MQQLKIEMITQQSFAPFGKVLEFSELSLYEITENLEVESVFHNFEKPLALKLS